MKPILEPLLIASKKTINGFRYEAPNFETPWHFHPQHELTYIVHSVGTKLVGDYVGPYEPGELVLLRSNLPHCWKNNHDSSKLSTSIVVQWNQDIFSQVPELEPVFNLLRKADKGLLFDKTQTALLLPMIEKLPNLEGHALYIQLLQLLVKLSLCPCTTLSAASFKDDLPSIYGNRMPVVHEFVANNFNRKIYLSEVADCVNMSEQSFSRFFSKMMGRSFFTFLNEYRINRAVRMLLDSDSSVSEIGYASGYESLPFFHKQFQKFRGCTPLVFQKRYKSS